MTDYTVGDTFHKLFTTRAFATGIPTVLSGSPVVSAYENEGLTQITAGITLGVDHDGVVGLNLLTIVATGGNGYETGKDYGLVITTGTVGGVSVVGEKVVEFTLGRSAAAVDLANGTDGLGAIKTDTAAILADTGTDGVKIAAAQGPVTFTGSTNEAGITLAGAGTGPGLSTTGGATGDGIKAAGGSTSGDGIHANADGGGNGMDMVGVGANAGLRTEGGATGPGIHAHGGATSGPGAEFHGHGASANAFELEVDGSGSANVSADVLALSGDATAADNLEAMFDGTGYVDETAPSSRAQVGAIGASSGGALSFEANADNSGGTIDPGSTVFVGVETNNFTDTNLEDGIYHIIADSVNVIDVVYGFSVGGGRTGSELIFKGFANANNDDLTLSVWGHVGAAWDVLGTLSGQNGSSNVTITQALLSRHTGTGSELGKVYVRFNGSGLSASADLNTDQILVEAVGIGQSVGYANGRIWVDTTNGIAGTEAFVNGVADKKVLTLADAKTLSGNPAVGLSDFHIINGSTITLAESTVNESYFGDNWTLALGGQDADGAYFEGAHVTGIGTSATEVHYEGCDVGTMSVQIGHFDFCSFDGTVTHTLAGNYDYHNCYSKVAGVGAPIFTKTAGQVVTVQFRNWSGSMTMSGIQASDVMTISGTELGDIVLNGADGTVKILGIYESLTDNRTGSPTLVVGAFEGSDVTDILADTVDIQTRIPAALVGGRMDSNVSAINNVAGAATQLEQNLTNCLTGTASGIPTTTTMISDIGVTVDDQYNGRIITFDDDTTTTALRKQSTDITGCTASSNTLTFTALTTAPVSGDSFTIT